MNNLNNTTATLTAIYAGRPLPQAAVYMKVGKDGISMRQVSGVRPFEGGYRWSVWTSAGAAWNFEFYFVNANGVLYKDGVGPCGEKSAVRSIKVPKDDIAAQRLAVKAFTGGMTPYFAESVAAA